MVHEVTADDRQLFDDVSLHALALWEKSLQIEGLSTDPKMFSIMLFKRLWSNHRGYALLFNGGFQLEADIILRSGIEASICIAANDAMREEFIELMHRDAAATLQGQIKMYREMDAIELVKETEAVLRGMQAKFQEGAKAAKLDWKALAEAGHVRQLYHWHRMLSGLSSHVTGASILTGVAPVDEPDFATGLLPGLQKKMHFLMMAGATLHGTRRHAGMIADEAGVETSVQLMVRLAKLSDALR